MEKLRAAEDQLHEDEKLHRKFCWSVMINVSKVDPDDVKKEEKRQKSLRRVNRYKESVILVIATAQVLVE